MSAAPLALLMAYLGFVAIGLPDGVLGIGWPSLRDTFGLPQSGLALILGAQTVGYLVAGAASAWCLRLLGVGTVLALSTAIVGAAALGFAGAPVLLALPLAALALGLGSAAIDAGLNAHAAAHFSARHMNWLHAAYGVGAALGPLLMTWALATSGSWRLGYGALALLLFVLAVLFWWQRGRWAATPPVRSGATTTFGPVKGAQRRLAAVQLTAFFLYTGVEAVGGQWSFAVLSEARNVPLAVAGTGTALFWTGLCLGRFGVGFIADRLGADLLVRLGALGTLAGSVVFLLAPGVLGIIGLVIMGAALAPIFPMLMLRTAERFDPALAARLFGLQVSAAMLGALVLPSLAGLAADIAGLSAIPALLAASAVLLCLLCLWLTRAARTEAVSPARS